MASAATTLADLLESHTTIPESLKGLAFWESVSRQHLGGSSNYHTLVAKVGELTRELDPLITISARLSEDEREYYRGVVKSINAAFSAPACNADTNTVIQTFLNRSVIMGLKTVARAIADEDGEAATIVDIPRFEQDINRFEADINRIKLDSGFARLIKRHTDRLRLAVNAYNNYGPGFLDRIIRSMIGDIAKIHAEFEDESEEAKTASRFVSILLGLISPAQTVIKLLAAPKHRLALPPPDSQD